jgi:hypothetical protein
MFVLFVHFKYLNITSKQTNKHTVNIQLTIKPKKMLKTKQSKNLKRLLMMAALVLMTVISSQVFAQNNVGINTITPDASAALDVQSTTQGMLIPRMNATQRGLIATLATGLLVYQTDAQAGFYFYDGATWTLLGATGPQGAVGSQGPQGNPGAPGAAGIPGSNGANGQGVPTGGNANQVLSKLTLVDYDFEWLTLPTPTPTLPIRYYICVAGIYPSSGNLGGSAFAIGSIQLFAGNGQQGGGAWLPCNGQLLNINQNPALFSLLGTTYGGNGVQTFGLPNSNNGSVPIGSY